MGHSSALGSVHEIALPGARIRYHQSGEGPPLVFVHGLLSNADLWRKVVPALTAAGYRCITPDWPLGSHVIPVPHADLTPPGLAALIEHFLDEMDLRDVTLIANDSGGGLTQILMARNPERVARVVLTPSDSYNLFPPRMLAILPKLARLPGSMWPLAQVLRSRHLQRLPFTFGWVAKRRLPPEVMDSFLAPSRRDPAIRKDLRRFLKGVHKRHTLKAATSFAQYTKPVLLAWATEDKLLPIRLADRLLNDFPNATLKLIGDSYTFVPEDQPEALVEHVQQFVRHHSQAHN